MPTDNDEDLRNGNVGNSASLLLNLNYLRLNETGPVVNRFNTFTGLVVLVNTIQLFYCSFSSFIELLKVDLNVLGDIISRVISNIRCLVDRLM